MVHTWAKYVYTAILCLNQMASGMGITAIGPVLTELVDILQTSPQYLTMFTTFTSTGFLIGSVFCFLLKYLNRQLIWTAFIAIFSVSVALVPHSQNLVSFYACAIGAGLGTGLMNTVINVWVIEMWRDKSSSILQIPGLTFGIGTILSPIIIKPFLREPYSVLQNSTLLDNSLTNYTNILDQNTYNQDYEEWRRSLLFTPFLIFGFIQLLFPILMIVMFCTKRYEYSTENSDCKSINVEIVRKDSKLFDRQREHRITVICLFAILLGVFNITECMYYTFGPTYFQYSPLHLSVQRSAEMITAFSIPFTIFRGIGFVIAIKVKSKYMLAFHYSISIIGFILLVLSRNSETVLWLANVVIGIGLSALMQTTIAFAGQYIQMTDKIGTILVMTLGAFNIGPPYLLGLFIKQHSIVFIYVEFVTLFICIALFFSLMYFIQKYERIEKIKNKSRLI